MLQNDGRLGSRFLAQQESGSRLDGFQIQPERHCRRRRCQLPLSVRPALAGRAAHDGSGSKSPIFQTLPSAGAAFKHTRLSSGGGRLFGPPGRLAAWPARGEKLPPITEVNTHTHIHLAARVPPESAGRVWRRALFALGARRRRRRRLVMTQRTAPNANRLLRRRRQRRWGSQSKVK